MTEVLRTCVVAFAAMTLVAVTGPASSATKAGDLLAQCETLEKTWAVEGDQVSLRYNDGMQCWGYLNAYYDIAHTVIYNTENPGVPNRPIPYICMPKGVGLVQTIRIFLQYARTHPAELHEDAFVMISTMLMKSFPCPEK